MCADGCPWATSTIRYHTATIAAPINPASTPSPRTECSRLLMLGSARVVNKGAETGVPRIFGGGQRMCSGSPAWGGAVGEQLSQGHPRRSCWKV